MSGDEYGARYDVFEKTWGALREKRDGAIVVGNSVMLLPKDL